jgi:hypothetical protein
VKFLIDPKDIKVMLSDDIHEKMEIAVLKRIRASSAIEYNGADEQNSPKEKREKTMSEVFDSLSVNGQQKEIDLAERQVYCAK